MLAAGGNAMDAAVAACLATAVTLPYFADLGGYVCAATLLDGASGRVWSVDANSIAPAAARANMFAVTPPVAGKFGINENEYECSVEEDANIYGPLAVSTPGFVAGVGSISERWGRLSWEQVLAGAMDLAESGCPYGPTAGHIEKRLSIISKDEPTRHLLVPAGNLPRPDEIWRRTDLAKTLRRLAIAGWRDFYEGEIGRRIGDHVSSIGGVMTRADMAAFEPRVSDTLQTTYRGAHVHGPVLPNGALSVLEILNMLECFEAPPLAELRYWHELAEVLKLAWDDRLRYLADPAFAEVPADMLLDKTYAAERVRPLFEFPNRVASRDRLPSANPHGTAHVSAADCEGNVVSATISQGNPFGACVTVPGLGFTLGHGMCRFDPRPGLPNSIAPGKRPLNNVCPLVIRLADRDIATGMRGGRRIVSAVAQIAHRLIDYEMSPRSVSTSVRIHTLSDEPIEYEASRALAFEKELLRMGHVLRPVDELGGSAHCVEFIRTTATILAGGSIAAVGV
jgi:gamma-glutamyltranspeptidase/glutathione hydrolase